MSAHVIELEAAASARQQSKPAEEEYDGFSLVPTQSKSVKEQVLMEEQVDDLLTQVYSCCNPYGEPLL